MSKDFENQAKKLGDDFKLQPRENVWSRIEEALDEKKRRRVAWWWWAAPVALLLGSGIWYYTTQQTGTDHEAKTVAIESTKNNNASNDNKIPNNTVNDKTVPQQASIATDHAASVTIQKENKPNSHTLSDEHNEPTISKKHDQKNIQPKNKYASYGLDQHVSQTQPSTRTRSNPEEKIQPPVASGTIVGTKEELQSQQIGKAVADQQVASASSSEPVVTNAVTEAIVSTDPKADETTTTNIVTDKKEDNNVDSKTEASLTAAKSGVTEDKSKKKVSWLIQAGAGMSSMGDLNLLPIGGQKSADQLQNSFNPTVVVPTPTRSDKAGLSLSAGIQRKQAISKRWQWSASLAWQYQQIQQYKGIKIDSAISITSSGASYSNSYYYTNGSNTTEKGSNHRMVLTNELSWQVMKNHPWLRLGAGVYTGYNIANNYYVVDNMQRLLKNDELYSKWFVGVTPSLQFELKNNIRINLNTHIDFTKAYKELNGNPKYWRGWEVRADFPIFNK